LEVSDVVVSGGDLVVNVGSSWSGVVVSSGGMVTLSGGTVAGLVLLSGSDVVLPHTQFFNDSGYGPGVNLIVLQGSGRAVSAVVGSGGAEDDYGFVSATIVGSGGDENVFGDGGYAISTTVDGGGTEFVYSRGRAYATVVSNGGTQIVLTHGLGSAATIEGGGRQYVYSSGTAASATVTNGGMQLVHGTASATVVQTGGTEQIFSGAAASGTLVSSGGSENIFGAGIGNSTAIESGGNEFVYSGAVATGTVVASGGSETLYADAAASGTNVDAGGVQYVYSSGTAVSTTIGSGGTLFIDSLGGATEVTIKAGGRIDLPSLGYAGLGSAVLGSDDVLTVIEGALSATLALAGDYDENYFALSQDSGTGTVVTAEPVACYCRGTRILTDTGEVTVEDLAIGNRLATVGGEMRVIRWIGHRRVDCRRHPTPACVHPIRLRANCLADGVPRRDLYLSPDHAVLMDGVLIPVRVLINGATVLQEARDEVSYWHIELERHEVILAEGLACETYLDTGNRSVFTNGGGAVQLHPDFSADQSCETVWHAAGYAPLRIDGEVVERIDRRLRLRAAALGYDVRGPMLRHGTVARTCDPADLLQPAWYFRSNPDVAASGLDAMTHYVGWGRREGRLPCEESDLLRGLGLVDPVTVAITMADVVAAGVDPVAHFLAIGWRERRRPNLYFDTGWYIDRYDVPVGMNPLVHYIVRGEEAGLAPSRPFDPQLYRQRSGIPPGVSALAHCLMHRQSQSRAPTHRTPQSAVEGEMTPLHNRHVGRRGM
jgi:autotransporter passenger strand-loop-strand repeat protein